MSRATLLLERMDGVTIDLDPSQWSSTLNDPKTKGFIDKVKNYFKTKKFKKLFAALIIIGVPIILIKKLAKKLRAEQEYNSLVTEELEDSYAWLEDIEEAMESNPKAAMSKAEQELDAQAATQAKILRDKFKSVKSMATWLTLLGLILAPTIGSSIGNAIKRKRM